MKYKNAETVLKRLASALKSRDIIHSAPPFTEHFIIPRLNDERGESIQIESLLKTGSRALIVGSSGTGKTKLIQFLASLQASKYLNNPRKYPCPILLYGRELNGISVKSLKNSLRRESET